jgi:hypothetical protein
MDVTYDRKTGKITMDVHDVLDLALDLAQSGAAPALLASLNAAIDAALTPQPAPPQVDQPADPQP